MQFPLVFLGRCISSLNSWACLPETLIVYAMVVKITVFFGSSTLNRKILNLSLSFAWQAKKRLHRGYVFSGVYCITAKLELLIYLHHLLATWWPVFFFFWWGGGGAGGGTVAHHFYLLEGLFFVQGLIKESIRTSQSSTQITYVWMPMLFAGKIPTAVPKTHAFRGITRYSISHWAKSQNLLEDKQILLKAYN